MTDMGVPGYLVASSVIGILAQRLVRVICSRCKTKYMPSEPALHEAGISLQSAKNAEFAHGKGCNYCQKKGFRGRNGIHELLVVNSKIRDLIFTSASTQEIRKQAINDGMRTLYVDGVQKAMKGLTTLEEVYRVAKRGEQDVIPE